MAANLKKILGFIVVVLLGFLGYQYIVNFSVAELKTAENSFGDDTRELYSEDNTTGKEIFDLYNAVSSMGLESKIFSSEAFAGLNDLATPLPALGVGRSNPFAPIGSGSLK